MFLTELATLSERLNVPMWDFKHNNRSILSALHWMMPYLQKCKKFEYGSHSLTKNDVLLTQLPVWRRAIARFGAPEFHHVLGQLNSDFGVEPELEAPVLIVQTAFERVVSSNAASNACSNADTPPY